MVTRQIGGASGLVSLFARHRNAANLVMVLMVIFGAVALGRINTQFFPKIEIPVVTVSVAWSGASAEDVEAGILEILEPELRYLDGVDRLTSRAREGIASVGIEYETGVDMKEAVREVETAVKAVTLLPEDSETPVVRQSTRGFDRVARLALTGDVSETALRFYAKKIRDDLIERGIDKIIFTGLRTRELHVDIPERELRRLNVTIGDVSDTISANSRDLPSGNMEGSVEKQLRTLAEAETPRELAALEVRSFDSGEKVLLGDIATITDGYKDGEPRGFIAGKPAIQIEIQRADSADTLRTNQLLQSYVAEVADQLPAGLELYQYDIRANALTERIMLLVTNGLGGLLIVVAVLFIFLNARIAFWVAAGIPVAMLATIGIMWLLGQSINMISLFGLIMMLGIIVDDAIVVGEHTATRFTAGDGPYEAAENGAGQMVTPVSAAMITTLAAFGPILVIQGGIGQIMGVLPIVVMAVIIASLVECFLILPGHLAHTLQPRVKRRWSYWRQFTLALLIGVFATSVAEPGSGGWFVELSNGMLSWVRGYLPLPIFPGSAQGLVDFIQAQRASVSGPVFIGALAVVAYALSVAMEAIFALLGVWKRRRDAKAGRSDIIEDGRFRRGFDKQFNRFRDGIFDKMVRGTYHFRYLTIGIAAALFAVGVVGMIGGGKVGFVFFPSAEAENINARLVFNAGMPEDKAIDAITRIEAALKQAEQELTGGDEKLIVASFATLGQAGRSTGDNVASIRVQLTSSEVRTVRTPEITKAWRRAMPKIAGVRRAAIFESRGGPPGRDIDIQLQGPDAAVLKGAATAIVPLVAQITGVSGAADDLAYGKPELTMQLLPRGAALGFSTDNVGRQLRNAFEGAIPRKFADGDDEVTIRVSKVMREAGTAALRNFELKSPAGDFVPLSEVVSISEKQGFAAIERIDGKTNVSVTADIDTNVSSTEEAIAALEASGLPAIVDRFGIDYKYSGRDEERREAFADLQIGAIIALSIIYIVLAWVFASYWRPLAVMLIIPFGVVGAVYGHYLIGIKLTILSFIGLLGLAGILVNDSIILVTRLDERLNGGDEPSEAAIGASRDRLRAVLLTSLTTIGGLVPLMFEKSLQAQFLLPMATTMVFGLASATILVLFLVPAFIGIGDDIGNGMRALFGSSKRQGRKGEPVGLMPAE
ncbi:efflux RND transporter permease subunit [Ahrensia sp. R2A130]|uniref:efflux RND transporter permease subunit n=1 Tax=Ahrensia sp. R2A130 TaxID=744979 RepID=UPI0001E0F0C5|nr:efflux RND transporter permease subunit [Ahrensia sp. R2A130]EFL89178.1 AcrB [Ahrensia sp. R2A130]